MSMTQAIHSTRPGGHIGYLGVAQGGPASVRRFLRDLGRLVEDQVIDLGDVFDLALPLDEAPRATGRRASAAPSSRSCSRDLR
jgi:threonine dehydrogenase-like Zn-dependent dehydrogenase